MYTRIRNEVLKLKLIVNMCIGSMLLVINDILKNAPTNVIRTRVT